MPINLPVRKTLNPNVSLHAVFADLAPVLAALSFAVALAGLVTQTPQTYRTGLSAAVYEAMLQSP